MKPALYAINASSQTPFVLLNATMKPLNSRTLVTLLTGLLAEASLAVQAASPPGTPQISIVTQSQTPPASAIELTQPAVAELGATAILTAEAEGSGPIQYQWFMNGALIDGATNAVHALQTLERADDGSYSVMATNSAGRAVSEPARLLVSNIKPTRYMSLAVNSPTGGVWQIQYADSLASNALWRPLAGVTSSAAPLVIVDPAPPNANQRFYRTTQTNTLVGRMAAGWSYPDPTGSVHTIEFIDPQAGSTNWRTLQTITLAQSPYLFADATATNGLPRRYRTTMLASPATRRAGALVSTVTWILPPAVYTNATQTNRQAFAALGISLNDQEHALQFPTNPVPGYWIVVGDQRVMTDTNGNFQIDVPLGVTNAFVVRSREGRSTQAEMTFDPRKLAIPGQTPAPIVLQYRHEGILNMDAPRQSTTLGLAAFRAAGGPICGNPCATVANSGCCLDYDGIVSDGCKYPDDLASIDDKIIRYIDSTCYRLVDQGLCANEFNALQTTDPVQYVFGPA